MTDDVVGGGALPPPGEVPPAKFSGRQLRELLADEAWLDELVDRADEGGVSLTGPGGFLPDDQGGVGAGAGGGVDRASGL